MPPYQHNTRSHFTKNHIMNPFPLNSPSFLNTPIRSLSHSSPPHYHHCPTTSNPAFTSPSQTTPSIGVKQQSVPAQLEPSKSQVQQSLLRQELGPTPQLALVRFRQQAQTQQPWLVPPVSFPHPSALLLQEQ